MPAGVASITKADPNLAVLPAVRSPSVTVLVCARECRAAATVEIAFRAQGPFHMLSPARKTLTQQCPTLVVKGP
jgi:hypothetical protein